MLVARRSAHFLAHVMQPFLRSTLPTLLSLLAGLFLLGCSSRLGYGVLLWTDPNSETTKGLNNGEIVTIVGESKSSHSYLFRYKASNEEHPIEISKVAFFRHLPNAKEYREKLLKYRDWYAVNMNPDGLVVRDTAEQNAEQVYRLRPRQTIKILNQVSDQTTLGNIEGQWYEILTEDGVRGFIFDYYLRIEDRSKDATNQIIKLAALEQNPNELKIDLSSLKGIWYQTQYAEQLRSGQKIDLRMLMLKYGQLYLDQDKNQLELYLETSSKASLMIPYNPEDIVMNSAAELEFTKSRAKAIFIKADEISLYFHDQNNEETILELQKISQEELQRYRQQVLAQRKVILASIFSNGSQFSAAKLYGSIRFQANGRFFWSNTSALEAEGLLQGNPSEGTLLFTYQLGRNLQNDYDQLLTFVFEDNQELTFLLKTDIDNNILLRYVPPFMLGQRDILNSDSFNEKLDIQMVLEGRPLVPVDLF